VTVFQTLEDVPGSVRNITVVIRQSSNTTTAVLTWQQPEEPNGVIIEYQVFYAGYEASSGIQQPQYGPHSITSQNLQAEIPEMVPGLTYQFKVRDSKYTIPPSTILIL